MTDPQPKRHVAAYAFVILLIASFGIGIWAGKVIFTSETKQTYVEVVNRETPENKTVDFSLFWRVWDSVLAKAYKQPVDQEKMFYGAIKGLVASIGDPYSSFMDPTETQDFDKELAGTLEGIGIEIGIKKEKLTVVAPIEGTPADKAGLRAGDWIIKINDEPTMEMSLDAAVQKIRGPKGTPVKLTVSRGGTAEPTDLEINRDRITVKSVKFKMLDGGIACVEMTQFGDDTVREFDRAVLEMQAQNARGLILDLRNNPGGLLDDAIKIGGEFLEQKVIVKEKDSDGSILDLRSEGPARLKDLPVVVLVNEGSASASEILAGALRDHRQIILIGTKTFGKGSVQDLESLPQETSLRITVAHWLTPNGNEIDDKGLEPDIKVELSDDDYNNDRDPQLDKAQEVIREKAR